MLKYNGINIHNKYKYTGTNMKYCGSINNNQYDGIGKLYYKNGKLLYEGEFKNGKFDGIGTRYNKNSTVMFSGFFYDGLCICDYSNKFCQ